MFIIFNLLSPLSTGIIYGAITGEHLSVVVRILVFFVVAFLSYGLPAVNSRNALMMRNEIILVLLCAVIRLTMIKERRRKMEKNHEENRIRSLDCYSIYGCLCPSLPLSSNVSRSHASSLTFIKLLLAVVCVRAR